MSEHQNQPKDLFCHKFRVQIQNLTWQADWYTGHKIIIIQHKPVLLWAIVWWLLLLSGAISPWRHTEKDWGPRGYTSAVHTEQINLKICCRSSHLYAHDIVDWGKRPFWLCSVTHLSGMKYFTIIQRSWVRIPNWLNMGVSSMFKSDFAMKFIEYQLNAQMYFVTICIAPVCFHTFHNFQVNSSFVSLIDYLLVNWFSDCLLCLSVKKCPGAQL